MNQSFKKDPNSPFRKIGSNFIVVSNENESDENNVKNNTISNNNNETDNCNLKRKLIKIPIDLKTPIKCNFF